VVCRCVWSRNHKNPPEWGGGQGPLGGYYAKRKKKFLPIQNLWRYILPYITPLMWQNVADGTRIAAFTCFNYVAPYRKGNALINKLLSVDSLVTGSRFLKPTACTQNGFVPYRALRSPTMGQSERNPAFTFIAFPLV